MNYTFGKTTQPIIRNNMKNKNTCVLALVMFYETRHKNATKAFIVLSCVIYTIIENYVFIGYISCQSNRLSVTCIDRKVLGNFELILGYIHYRFVNKLIVRSWFHKNREIYCHVIMSLVDVVMLFFE